jgi:hypothetical protein
MILKTKRRQSFTLANLKTNKQKKQKKKLRKKTKKESKRALQIMRKKTKQRYCINSADHYFQRNLIEKQKQRIKIKRL